ncbi:MAG: FkbM family methyltransferase [Lentilitoribacter sp.]
MPFLSFAQNLEDVVLRRALKDIAVGFYIDVGACSPDQDSVTRSLYDSGWSGINIEPNPEYYSQLVDKRDRDINLQIAAGQESDRLELNIFSGTGLSTLNKKVARKHSEADYIDHMDSVSVDVLPLSEVWNLHVAENQDVHFLKVDVEGFEAEVLKGLDWKKNRPWIILVEATKPMVQEFNYSEWEFYLIENDYVFVYEDGLNRFYVSKEKIELSETFRFPPCVFDNYVLASYDAEAKRARKALQNLDNCKTQSQENLKKICLLENEKRHLILETQKLRDELTSIQQSRIWKMTTPLRFVLGKVIAKYSRS